MKTKYLDKVLKNHNDSCSYWIFSGDRHCSCGRDGAIYEKEVLVEAAELLVNIKNWLDLHGALEPNSFAQAKIDFVVSQLENMK